MAKYQYYVVTIHSVSTKCISLRRLLGGLYAENCANFGKGTGPKWNQFPPRFSP